MSRRLHKVLNRVLPARLRESLRRAAQRSIPTMRHLDMPVRLRQVASMGFGPGVIYDIGAFDGEWARLAHEVWPKARIISFEPNVSNRPALERTTQLIGADLHKHYQCFLGSRKQSVTYVDRQSGTSVYLAPKAGDATVESPMLVLDELLASGEIPPPDFMKLDVQGYEIEVLKGATKAMEAAQGMLLEVSWFHITAGMPLVLEVLNLMQGWGFEWYDVMGIYRRPSDDALGQMDFMFLRKGHKLLRDTWD